MVQTTLSLLQMNLALQQKMNFKYWWVIHAIIWVGVGVIFSVPDYDWTIGPFNSKDGSVVIPIVYGSLLNALIFYGNAYYLMKRFLAKAHYLKYWVILVGLFLSITIVESLLDTGWYIYFYDDINKVVLEEIAYGNIFLNGLLFLVPSIFYRFAMDWVTLSRDKLTSANVKEKTERPNESIISVKTGKTTHKIAIDTIEFIESKGNSIVYHFANNQVTTRETLATLEKQLPNNQFIRCHKSFIISKKHVEKIDYDFIYLPSSQVPIGRVYRENVNQFIS